MDMDPESSGTTFFSFTLDPCRVSLIRPNLTLVCLFVRPFLLLLLLKGWRGEGRKVPRRSRSLGEREDDSSLRAWQPGKYKKL